MNEQKALAGLDPKGHPSQITFMLKNTCNASCVMCGLSYAANKNVKEIDLVTYKSMIENLDMGKVEEIIFSGGGDPLLAKDFVPIVEYTRKIRPDARLILFTNGIALNEKLANVIVKNNFVKVVISINASTPETYSKVMGVNSFNKVVANAGRLVGIRNACGGATHIRLTFAVSRLNCDDLPGLVVLGKQVGANDVAMHYCRFYTHKYRLDAAETDRVMDQNLSLFFHQEYSDKLVKKAEETAARENIVFNHEPLFETTEFSPQKCKWPWTAILVGPEGEIYPCCGAEVKFHKPLKENRVYFGNILKEHLYTFWNNQDYEKLRQSSDYGNLNKSMGECYNCSRTMSFKGAKSKQSHLIEV